MTFAVGRDEKARRTCSTPDMSENVRIRARHGIAPRNAGCEAERADTRGLHLGHPELVLRLCRSRVRIDRSFSFALGARGIAETAESPWALRPHTCSANFRDVARYLFFLG